MKRGRSEAKPKKQEYMVWVFHPHDKAKDFIVKVKSWSPTEAEMDVADKYRGRYCRRLTAKELRQRAGA